MYTYVHTYMYMCVCVYARARARAHTHTHTHSSRLFKTQHALDDYVRAHAQVHMSREKDTS